MSYEEPGLGRARCKAPSPIGLLSRAVAVMGEDMLWLALSKAGWWRQL